MKQGRYDFRIPQGKRNQDNKPLIPIRNGWIDKYTEVQCTLSKGWGYKWAEEKANTDIQKLFGYTLDPIKCNIIRLGINNGYSSNPKQNRYEPGKVHLYAYLTKDFKRYSPAGYGKMYIATVNWFQDFRVGHQLNSKGHPYFFVSQNDALVGALYLPFEFKDSGIGGYEMYPYVEYGSKMMGAPVDLFGSLRFEECGKLSDEVLKNKISYVPDYRVNNV